MTVYLEPHVPTPTVLIVGCGHVGRAVAELALLSVMTPP